MFCLTNASEILNISGPVFFHMAAGKWIHDRKMTDNPMLSVIWFLKHIKQNSNWYAYVLGVHLFNGSNIYVTIGDAITPEINMATEKRTKQLELHSSRIPYNVSPIL